MAIKGTAIVLFCCFALLAVNASALDSSSRKILQSRECACCCETSLVFGLCIRSQCCLMQDKASAFPQLQTSTICAAMGAKLSLTRSAATDCCLLPTPSQAGEAAAVVCTHAMVLMLSLQWTTRSLTRCVSAQQASVPGSGPTAGCN